MKKFDDMVKESLDTLEDSYAQLNEGVDDKGIFKAVFLAGGPGSGKSWVTQKVTGGLGLKIITSDDAFVYLLNKSGLSLKMPKKEEERRLIQRDLAKKITNAEEVLAMDGRIGVVIDGTGRDAKKIIKIATKYRALGYDISMIFVDTALDVALARNKARARTIDEDAVRKNWKEVQENKGRFKKLFGAKDFKIIDNSDPIDDEKEKHLLQAWKETKKFIERPVRSELAKNWIIAQRELKKRK